MDAGTFVLVCCCFMYLGLLPFIFFRSDGVKNVKWWLTAAPFFITPLGVCSSYFGVIVSFFSFFSSGLSVVLPDLFLICSLILMAFTMGTHRIPLSLWHQSNDAPQSIVTWGAYRYIRHPFYTSFLLAQFGSLLYAPNLLTYIGFVYGIVALSATARIEEKKLSDSHFGETYQAYIQKTGRFFPKIG